MRKIRIIEFISLDGVIQAPGGPGEDGDYPYGGWTLPHPVEDLAPDIVDGVRRIKAKDGPDLIVWGSSTLTPVLLEHGLADEV